MTEKLLIYGLGRGLTPRDMSTVRTIVRESAPRNYRFSDLVLAIVKSEPFRMKLKSGTAEEVEK
jgi:hypothetical protein